METSHPSIPMIIQEKYDANITAIVTLTSDEDGKKNTLIRLVSHTTGKVALLLNQVSLITFKTPFGPQEWINEWGILEGSKLLLVDDGFINSIGIYMLDGENTRLNFTSTYQTTESVYRIERSCISQAEDNPLLLKAAIETLSDVRAYGPE